MSRLSEKLQKKLLPSAEFFIKSVESRYQEPLKQAQLINKEIATLRNPRNIRAASRQSAGAYTQLLNYYLKASQENKQANASVVLAAEKWLDSEQERIAKDTALYNTNDFQNYISGVIDDGTFGNSFEGENQLDSFNQTLKNKKLIGKDGVPTLSALMAWNRILQDPTTNEQAKPFIRQQMALIAKQVDTHAQNLDVDKLAGVMDRYVNFYHPNLNPNTPIGRANREARLRPQFIRKHYDRMGLTEQQILQYDTFEDEIAKLQKIVMGGDSELGPSITSLSPEQKQKLIQDQPGLKIENDRVVVDEEASEVQKKGAEIILNAVGTENPTVDEFVQSSAVQGAYGGLESSKRVEEKMEARAQELEQLLDQRLAAAQQEGRLSPAEMSVLTNPLFTRTGFRRTPSYGLLKRRQQRLAREPVAAATPVEPAAEPAEEVEEAPAEVDKKLGSAGVPIIPAIINRFKKAYDRATTADDSEKDATHRELTDVVNGFKRLPEDIQSQFPRNFLRAVYEFGTVREGKDDTPEQQQTDLASAIKSLDDAAITTKTIGEYVADVGSDPNATALESTANMVEFLKHPDSAGEGSSVVGRKLPVGSVAFRFLDTMNQIGTGEASKSDLISVFEEARGLSQQDRPDFFDTDKYGRYESVDNFVAAMDSQRGGISRERTRRRTESDRPQQPTAPIKPKEEDYPLDPMQRDVRDYIAAPDGDDELDQKVIAAMSDVKSADQSRAEQRAIAKAQQSAYDQARDMAGGLTDDEINKIAIANMATTTTPQPSNKTQGQADSTGSSEAQIAADLAENQQMMDEVNRAPVDPKPPADPGREQAIADFNARPGQAPHGSVFPVVSPGSQETDDDQSRREQAIADFNARPGQAPHGSVFPVVSPGSQEMDDDQSLTEADEAAIARADQPPVDYTPVEEEKTPDQQLAEVQASLPEGNIPRIDTSKTGEEMARERKKRSQDVMLITTNDLLKDIKAGKLSLGEAYDAATEMAEVYGKFVGPNYREKLYQEIDKAFNVRPEADPTPEQPYSLDPKNLPVVEPKMLTNKTNNAKILRDEFTKLGYSKNQIEAFVATAMAESKLDATSKNMGTAEKPEDSHGLFQFNRRRGEGVGLEISQLQNPYFQVMKVHEAISTRPELAFFKNNPDASAEDLIVNFNKNYVRPAGIRGQEKQDERKAYIPYARRELAKLETPPVQVASP